MKKYYKQEGTTNIINKMIENKDLVNRNNNKKDRRFLNNFIFCMIIKLFNVI